MGYLSFATCLALSLDLCLGCRGADEVWVVLLEIFGRLMPRLRFPATLIVTSGYIDCDKGKYLVEISRGILERS